MYNREELRLRLCLVQEHYSKSVSQFSKLLGKNQVTVNNYMSGSRDVSIDFISDILFTFTDISADWLMRGEGEMLKQAAERQETDTQPSEHTNAANPYIEHLMRENESLMRMNAELCVKYHSLSEKFVNTLLSGSRIE